MQEFSDHANNYMKLETPYRGETKVIHYLELLRDVVGFDNVKKAVVNPLKGRKVGAYYGCLLLRPGQGDADGQPRESHASWRTFIRAIGAEPVVYANRNECCGGYAVMEDRSHRAEEEHRCHAKRRRHAGGNAGDGMSPVPVQPDQEQRRRKQPAGGITSPSCWPRRWA